MNKRILLLAAGVLIGLLLGWGLSTLGALGEKKSRSAAVNSTGVSPGDEETSRDWQSQDLGDPGLRHAELDQWVGNWEGRVRFWEDLDEDARHMVSRVERRWVMGRRFIKEQTREQSETSFEIWNTRGRRPYTEANIAYRSQALLGFDRLRQVFEYHWIHDDSTRMYHASGRLDASSRVLNLVGEWLDPYDGSTVSFRYRFDLSNPDQQIVERFISDDGLREFRDLEIVYTRVAD